MVEQPKLKKKEELKYMGLLIKMTEVVVATLEQSEQNEIGISDFVLDVVNYTKDKEELEEKVKGYRKAYDKHRTKGDLKGLLEVLSEVNAEYVTGVQEYRKLTHNVVLLVRLFSENISLIKPHLKESDYTKEQLETILLLRSVNVYKIYRTVLLNSELSHSITSDGLLEGIGAVTNLLDKDKVSLEEVLKQIDSLFEEVVDKVLKIVSIKEELTTYKEEKPNCLN